MPELIIAKNEKIQEMENKIDIAVDYAKKVIVENDAQAEQCSDELKMVKKFIKELETRKLESTASYRDAVSSFNNDVKVISVKATEAKVLLETVFIKYSEIKEAEAIAEANRIKQIEIDRIAKEAKDAEEAITATAEENNTPDLLDQAIGINDEAQEQIDAISSEPVKVSTISRGFISSTTLKKTWKAEIVDMPVFLQYIINSKRFELVKVDDAQLNNYARIAGKSIQEKAKTINGIRIYQKVSTGTR